MSLITRYVQSAGHGVYRLWFMGIEAVRLMKRGGDREWKLLQRKAYWKNHLQTVYPGGLNEEFSSPLFGSIYSTSQKFGQTHPCRKKGT